MIAPTVAFDFSMLATPPERGTVSDHGWCYGLPPGIAQNQWPLSPCDGHPMQPCFTLRIPEPYRARGHDYVALAMFADQQRDEPEAIDAVAEYLATDKPGRPSDPDLLPFWNYTQNRHPMEFRMTDVIDHNFAAIWLTAAEFAGPLCPPPRMAGNSLLRNNPPPPWIEKGSARAAFELQVGHFENVDEIAHKYCYRLFGHVPDIGHGAYAISKSLREGDPNVGKPPRDTHLHPGELGDYITPDSEAGKRLGLPRLSGRNHLGGTMFACQWAPKFSPTYLEFEEHFGGFNFGGGNAQLDLETMTLEWACG